MPKPARARVRKNKYSKPKKRVSQAHQRLRQRPPMRWWQVPKLWPGSTVIVIGGGPSVSTTPLELVQHLPCIGVNNAFKLGSWVDAMYFGDCRWFDWHKEAMLHYGGIKTTTCERHREKAGIKLLKRVNNVPLARERDSLAWNKSSGAAAVNLAVHFGAKRIILVGFDMRQIDGKNNYHDEHQSNSEETVYKRFKGPFPQMARVLTQLGVEVINATPGSALNTFPIMTLEQALAID